MQKYDFAVFIGRFQPFHTAHAAVIEHGFKIAKKVIVLVGSANRPRSLRNPFTFEERAMMIREWWGRAPQAPDAEFKDLIVLPLPDAAYDDLEWTQHVQQAVRTVTSDHVAPKIALIGSDKDNSTFYLRLFPQWTFEGSGQVETINASAIREAFFEGGNSLWDSGHLGWLPATTEHFLALWRGDPAYAELMAEQAFIRQYRKDWGVGPFIATDAVVVQSGHVLLVERGRPPGVGKLALPGGFLNVDETLLQGSLRELAEETGLVIPIEDAERYLKAHHVFDDPHRSARARMLTGAFLFELPPGPLPSVTGMDDAADAKWVPLADLRTDNMFADHAFIIRHLLAKGK